jgi:hypothetical protein
MSSFFFIDDSGSKEWNTPYSRDFVDNPPARTAQNREFWQNNYFVLAGLHIDQDTVREVNTLINAEKIRVFGTKHVEIHSVDLRNNEKRTKHYIDKYNITPDQLKDFIEDFWYGLLRDYSDRIRVQAVIVDKRYYKNQRPESKPLMLAVQALFDRVELHPNRSCEIVFDQMENEIKSLRHDQGQILKVSSKEIDLHSFHQKYSHTSVVFEQSKTSNFLQLADVVAYNVLRQFVDRGDVWEQQGWDSPYLYFEKVMPNMHANPANGEIKGWGIVKLPDPERKR